jgi:hypothetical protein
MAQDKLTFEREQLANETPSKILDMMYKGQLMQESAERSKASAQERELVEIKDLPGVKVPRSVADKITQKKIEESRKPENQPLPFKSSLGKEATVGMWAILSKEFRDWDLYKSYMESQNKEAPSYERWIEAGPTERSRYVQRAMDDPKFAEMAKELGNKTEINFGEKLGQKVQEKTVLGGVERQQSILDSAFPSKVLDDITQSGKTKLFTVDEANDFSKKYNITYQEAKSQLTKAKHRQEIDSRVKKEFPNAVYRKGQGWYDGEKLIVVDPYRAK